MRLTPSMQQYMHFKQAYKECILLFQMGDFYETFFDDAKTVSNILNIVLTSREKDNPIPMAGFPTKALNQYLPKLVNAGYKVAIAKQIEDASQSKGLVKRKVVEIVTQASLTTQDQIGKHTAKYLAAIYREKPSALIITVALADILSGTIFMYTLPNNISILLEFIKSQELKEAVVNITDKKLITNIAEHLPVWPTHTQNLNSYKRILKKHFKVSSLLAIGLQNDTYIVNIGLLLDYIKYLKDNIPKQLNNIRLVNPTKTMYIDHITIKNLNLLPTKSEQPSLLSAIDNTKTPMGFRMLYESIKHPSKDISLIQKRLNLIEILKNNPNLLENLQKSLKQIHDIERITGLLGINKISPKQLLLLKNSLMNSIDVINKLPSNFNPLFHGYSKRQILTQTKEIINLISYYIREDASNDPSSGPIINEKNFPDIKKLRVLTTDTQTIINTLLEQLKNKYKIEKIKLGMNKIYGYYFEIPKGQAYKLPPDIIRKQTLVNTERFVTPELKELESKIEAAQVELIKLEQFYLNKLKTQLVKKYITKLTEIYKLIAQIDFLASGAKYAIKNNCIKPQIVKEQQTYIEEGRHPIIELTVDQFIPNDTKLDRNTKFTIITGPNMGGKSTYIRQVASIQLLAQIGYFIPAKKAYLSIKDRIFARVGASDNLAEQMSTFMVEMSEIANIIKNATKESLIILDEVGRGTSAWEGISLAYAISEFIINKIQAHTLLATHYYELTSLADKYPIVKNLKVDVYENKDDVIFLHTVSPGVAEKSYGIHIAKMVNLPQEILIRAEELLTALNQRTLPTSIKSQKIKHDISNIKQPKLIQVDISKEIKAILKNIENVDPNNTTPLQALQLIVSLKKKLNKIKYV